ncbi:MAG: replication-associated recombination protein A [Candidatus Eremiobacteraeota bacterium]|nr:replication-associated recombination protein A [Candidatus Eremiobacteraeota bacterium]
MMAEMIGLFDGGEERAERRRGDSLRQPLAARMRPRTLDEFVGQQQVIGPGRALRRAIEADTVPSMILWGPPGTGKTTLAGIIAHASGAHFVALSAVSAGVADLRRVVADAQKVRATGRRTVLFIDEIHRFNKAQQDAVLPYVEDGTVTMIGATTENPSFEVNSALLSRSRVFVLQALSDSDVRTLVERALDDRERGVAALDVRLTPEALDALVGLANGDARVALSTLEFAASAARPNAEGTREIDTAAIADALQRRATGYDKAGDAHYDTISAFIKTIRGSDPDAAVYWLARMIESGEDPLFIARRLVILASEDVGLADRHALPLAMAAQQAVHFVGMPEGFYPLAHATLYLAAAPKSNAVGRAYSAALADVQATRNDPVPLHLRNAPTGLMKSLGYGEGYRYAHEDYAEMDASGDLPPAVVLQPNLPDTLTRRAYFQPGRQGDEARLRAWIDERRGRAPAGDGEAAGEDDEL